MTVKNTTITLDKEIIMDDTANKDENATVAANLDLDKLAELKAKLEAKKTAEVVKSIKPKIVEKVQAIRWGILGSGECGGRIAEAFYALGNDVICLNTASVDLNAVKIPESNKVLLDNSVGGSAKSLELGEQATIMHSDKIAEAVNTHLANAQVIILAISLGGGSGSGSLSTLVDIVSKTGKPIVCICVLPQTSDDGLSKNNALITLSKLSKLTQEKKVASIICIDNAKIEQIYCNASQLDFFSLANKEIVSQLTAMNYLANSPGITKSIDKMEWLKILLDGEAFSIYGSITVNKFKDELDLAEALLMNVEANLLSGSFDIKQAKYCGVFLTANENVWKQIPSSAVNYCLASINDDFAAPEGVFKGTYIDNDIKENNLIIYFFYSGLGLPIAKINALKEEVEQLNATIKSKAGNRNISLEFNAGTDKTLSKADELKGKIAAKNSAFGKFISNTVDRRNK